MVNAEERLGAEAHKGKLLWVIVVASIVFTFIILALIVLKSFGLSELSEHAILVLSSGTVIAVVGYMGVIVSHYWHQ